MLPGKKYGAEDYLALARRHWWIVASTTAIGAFVALVVSSQQRDRYQSEMLVQIVAQRVPDAFVRSTVTARTEDRMASLEAQVKSRTQLERLIREFDLYAPQRRQMPMEDVVEIMRSAITVDLLRPARTMPADAFYVRYTYSEPTLAARVTAKLGDLFAAQNAKERTELAEGTNQFLEGQLAEAKARLEAGEQKVERFRQQNAGRLPTQSDFNLQAIQTHQSQLQALVESSARDRDRRLVVQRLYADASAEPAPVSVTPSSSGPTSDTATATIPVAQQLDMARSVLSRLEARLTEQHPDLRRQRKLVTDLERQLTVEPRDVAGSTTPPTGSSTPEAIQRRARLTAMKAELESIDRQIAFKEAEERRLRVAVAGYQARLEAVPGVESEWVALTRDYNTLQLSYENLLRKSEDAKVSADLERIQGGEQFRIVDSAQVPPRPVGAIRLQTNAIGTGAGLLIGCVIVGLLFVRDTTFHSEADVLDVLALPVLALVPYIVSEVDRQRQKHRRMLVRGAVALTGVCGAIAVWSMQLWRYVA